jgi:ribosomal protein L18E
MLIVESKTRESARKRLTRMVKKLRTASSEDTRITARTVAEEVEAVRRSHAGPR